MANESQPTNTAPVVDSTATSDSGEAIEASTGGEGTGENVQTAESTLKNPKATKVQKKQAEKQLKKLKLKIDGEEFDEEFDPNDDEYMTRQLQLAKVAQKRMQDFASLQKEVVAFVQDLKKNPRKALSDPAIGLDIKQLAAQIIEEEIAESKKSPEQIEKEKLQAELQEMKDQREREKAENQAKEYQRLVEQTEQQYDMQIDSALQKTDLPKEDYVVKKIADYLFVGLKSGKDVSVDDVMPLVREEIINDLKHLINVLPDEELDKFVGKDLLDRMRKKNVAKAKATKQAVGSNRAPDVAKKNTEGSKKSAAKKTFKDFFGV